LVERWVSFHGRLGDSILAPGEEVCIMVRITLKFKQQRRVDQRQRLRSFWA
jgi:hypothetical protein